MVLASDNVRTRFQFHQVRNNKPNTHGVTSMPNTWILLDNQSTIDVFCNPTMLANTHKIEEKFEIQCTAGTISTNLMGTLNDYGDVWYHADGIVNILSLSQVFLEDTLCKQYR
jgi:hypothetical protein